MNELTPVQRLLLEVYRVHLRPGYAGDDAGRVKHDVTTCRKCALLDDERTAFEDALPFASVAHLLAVGHSPRARP